MKRFWKFLCKRNLRRAANALSYFHAAPIVWREHDALLDELRPNQTGDRWQSLKNGFRLPDPKWVGWMTQLTANVDRPEEFEANS